MFSSLAASADELSDEVARLLASDRFAKSSVLSTLLRFLHDRQKHNPGEATTEYLIAQDLLGRGADFDPKIDPIVRVRIRRLREALDAYYTEHPGPVRITIPARSYDLRLEVAEKRSSDPNLLFKVAGSVIAAVATIGIGIAAYSYFLRPIKDDYPIIKIFAVQNLTGDDSLDIFQFGLQRQLGSDLKKFGKFRVLIVSDSNMELDAEYTLRSDLLALGDELDLSIRLETAANEQLVYGDRFRGPVFGKDYYETIREISRTITGQIAGQGGPMMRQEDAEDTQGEVTQASLLPRIGVGRDVFRCIVLKDRFFDDYDPEAFRRAYRCFEQVLPDIGDDPIALTSWGTLIFHAVPEFNLMQTEALSPDMLWREDTVAEAARTIAERFPHSADAFLLLGSVQNAQGLLQEAEISLRQAVELNPGNSTGHAVLSYLYLSQEEFASSIASAEEAIRLSVAPQSFIQLPIVISALVLGDDDRAIEAGKAYVAKRTGNGATAIRLIVARLENDRAEIARLTPIVQEMDAPMELYALFLRGDQTREAIREALPEADLGEPTTDR